MRHAMIMAGGSGTRLWPMSRRVRPKQLIPFLDGRTLLHMAWERLEGLLDPEHIYVCASRLHREVIQDALSELPASNFIGEPTGRDTLNAVGLSALVAESRDPDAVLAVVTADHIIQPRSRFQGYLRRGFELVEADPNTIVTFGITPTAPATGFGYLELAEPIATDAFLLRRFQEKPAAPVAQEFYDAGPHRYLWNSGMFVWHVRTLLDCVRRYEPATFEGLQRIRQALGTDHFEETVEAVYPTLRKISVDYAVMEPASQDPALRVVAVPMTLEWMDVGNWRSFALTCPQDERGNRIGAQRSVLVDCDNTLVASSDPDHLIAVVGCQGLMVVHTPDATLICPAELAEAVKDLTARIEKEYGSEVV